MLPREFKEEKMLRPPLAAILRARIFKKSPINLFIRINRRVWNHLPPSIINLAATRSYGVFLNRLARLSAIRKQNSSTFFFRNRPELELIRRLSDQKPKGSTLRLLVLACSTGAEVYSILWTIRLARPDLKVITHAVDISKEALEFAQKGVYSLTPPHMEQVPIFERMCQAEIEDLFDHEGKRLKIKSWLKEEITWYLGDARDPEIVNVLGCQDIVVANRFLCHMDPPDAERCLRNIARLVNPGGYLLVSGVDLDVRTKVACDLGWEPIQDLIEEIHEGDPSLRDSWPCGYWGLEPLNKRIGDWKNRYASSFRLAKICSCWIFSINLLGFSF